MAIVPCFRTWKTKMNCKRVCENSLDNMQVGQSNPVNMDTEGAIESVWINGVCADNRLNLEEMKGFLFPGTKQTVHNSEVSILRASGVRKAGFDCNIFGE